MAHSLCCMHPQQRVDSPEPPSRAPLMLDGVLAAAALPEDHPHALRFPDKKPEMAYSIVRSPGIASKLKSQFRRKSLQVLRNDGLYDQDARPVTSLEVIDAVDGEKEENEAVEIMSLLVPPQEQVRSLRRASTPVPPSQRESQTDVRMSVVRGLEWLSPMIER